MEARFTEAPGRESRHASSATALDTRPHHGDDLVPLLYKDFRATLFSQVLALTNHDRQWTEDVVQETMIRAWQHSGTLEREPGMLRGWLLTVARRIVIDGWRNRRIRPQEVALEIPENAASTDRTDSSLAALTISRALSELDEKYQSVIHETYLAGNTVRQAATILGIPEGTVKSRLYTAMRQLRKALGEVAAR
ncbi:sigma-70 family RNA polymerase sigma factor [Amycolatopsis sp. OK19-0408]|uniref:Sigma-70 family RNA polymerase sigma factor n=1 Tax=Amycolatopsis iheyensis TaxID=2945988 RepID=A0A9X2SNL4_9PSEU|nr:sigma-70 family RNA polymerase sigma factor [Amycolatopsis iheyensis]MCR6486595.1 sigma-70 family RNA polymerase sigma factor [Amycolatopsis iheyensis]